MCCSESTTDKVKWSCLPALPPLNLLRLQPISFTRVSSREVTSRMLGLRSSMDVPFVPLPALSSPRLNKSDTDPDVKALALADDNISTSSLEDTINVMSVSLSSSFMRIWESCLCWQSMPKCDQQH